MTEQEQADLNATLEAVRRQKDNYFELSRTIARADEHVLETMGFKGKTKGEAILFYFERISRDIDKQLKAHTHKYPD